MHLNTPKTHLNHQGDTLQNTSKHIRFTQQTVVTSQLGKLINTQVTKSSLGRCQGKGGGGGMAIFRVSINKSKEKEKNINYIEVLC